MAKEKKEVFYKGVGVSKTEDEVWSIDLLEYTTDGFLKVESVYKTKDRVDAFDRAKIILARDVRPV